MEEKQPDSAKNPEQEKPAVSAGTKQLDVKKTPLTKPLEKQANPFFWPQVIEWTSIALAFSVLAGGGIFLIYPGFQKYQSAPQNIQKNKEELNKELENYQNAAKIIDRYGSALSSSSQELSIVGRAFWENYSADNARAVLSERAELYGASVINVKERNDLADFSPDMRVFDVQIKGSSAAISSFVQTFETELPIVWPISETAVSDELYQLTVGLLKEPLKQNGEVLSFNEDLYSFPKFRIIKESNVDY